MPVNTVRITNLNSNSERCYDRNWSVGKIINAFAVSFQNLHEFETLRYNLTENAKRIESDLYKMAASENEYFRLIAEKIEDIQNKIKDKRREIKEKTDSTQAAVFRDSQGWRFFYTPTLRRAVVNAFIEDIRKKVEIPLRYEFGLRIGVEQVEKYAFKKAETKVDYFSILERKKVGITSELKAYFKEDA